MSPAQELAFTRRMQDIEEMIEASRQRMILTKESMKRCDEGKFNYPMYPLAKMPTSK